MKLGLWFGIIYLFILSGCASRCDRFYSRHPECLKEIQIHDTIDWRDTIHHRDTIPVTVIVEPERLDTSWAGFNPENDSAHFEDGNISVTLYIKGGHINVSAQYNGDTIYKEVPYYKPIPYEVRIPYETIVEVPVESESLPWWFWLLVGLASGLGLCVLRRRG